MTKTRTRVLYIAGTGRSGSTLLERMLGEMPHGLPAGELTHLWRRGYLENQLCGCNRPFGDCSFWGEVLEEAFGQGRAQLSHVAALRDRVLGFSRIPLVLWPGLRTRRFQRDVQEYSEILSKLYRAIAAVSGREVIIDSSKYPSEAYLLSSIDSIDPAIVHIVRNSHAVVHSWLRWKHIPEIHWKRAYMGRYPSVQTAISWSLFNSLIERLGRDLPYRRVRYEDLVLHPARTLRGLSGFAGLDIDLDRILEPGGIRLGEQHTVSGNPMRFETGRVPLELDSEWVQATPWWRRIVVHLLTFPIMHRYEYGFQSWRKRKESVSFVAH